MQFVWYVQDGTRTLGLLRHWFTSARLSGLEAEMLQSCNLTSALAALLTRMYAWSKLQKQVPLLKTDCRVYSDAQPGFIYESHHVTICTLIYLKMFHDYFSKTHIGSHQLPTSKPPTRFCRSGIKWNSFPLPHSSSSPLYLQATLPLPIWEGQCSDLSQPLTFVKVYAPQHQHSLGFICDHNIPCAFNWASLALFLSAPHLKISRSTPGLTLNKSTAWSMSFSEAE